MNPQFSSHPVKLINCLLLALVFLSACGTTPDPELAEDTHAPTSTTLEIDKITEDCAAIEQLFSEAKLQMDTVHYQCPKGAKGGKIDIFQHTDEVKLIRHTYFEGDHLGGVEKFYLQEDELRFVHIEETAMSMDTDFAPASDGTIHTRDDITEKRFYFTKPYSGQNPLAISCLTKSYVLRSAIDLPTNPEEIKNQQIDCNDEAQIVFHRFLDLMSGTYLRC